jgi:hypothetical protein
LGELEEELLYWAHVVYRFPEFGPTLDWVERILHDAREHTAKAKRILDVECEKLGCPPINSIADLEHLGHVRGKRLGVRMLARSLGRWSR